MKKQLKSKKYGLFEAPSLSDAKMRKKHDIENIIFSIDPKYKNIGINK